MLRFAFQIFLSAFLLFQIQPIVARFILPSFGGASNVWTICLVFFQVFLLIGYLYAYLLDRWLPPVKQALVHSALVAVAIVVFLPIDFNIASDIDQHAPHKGIVMLLLASVGLPYALISSSGPLFQSWFRSRYPNKNTYRLYALSNVGSLLGLLSYPFLIEPMLTLGNQSLLWSIGFGIYFLWTLTCFWSLRQVNPVEAQPDVPDSRPALSAKNIVSWIFLAGIATTLLLATTNKITMDVASIPFLWVLPLSLYLITFIISFDKPKWYDRSIFIPLLLAACLLGLLMLQIELTLSIYVQVGSYLVIMFIGCMVCHGELYRLRPNPLLLTRYYLFISFGGAVGGIFVALVAPLIFNDYFELHLSWVALLIVATLCVFPISYFRNNRFNTAVQVSWIVCAMVYSVLLFNVAKNLRFDVVYQVRGFYGVLKVSDTQLYEKHATGADRYLTLAHGSTQHGRLYFDDETPLFLPTAYYTDNSGVGMAIASHSKAAQEGLDVGVVGMGVATISALCKQCKSISFYEIDPNILAVERDWFSNLETLREHGVESNVYLGDGRQLLESQIANGLDKQYDVLAIDAFSSDSIPVHLLTMEAFEIYTQQLRPNGVLAVHVSNRHLDLVNVVSSLASDSGYQAVYVNNKETHNELDVPSKWVLISNDKDFIASFDLSKDNIEALNITGFAWTDQYSNLFSVLR